MWKLGLRIDNQNTKHLSILKMTKVISPKHCPIRHVLLQVDWVVLQTQEQTLPGCRGHLERNPMFKDIWSSYPCKQTTYIYLVNPTVGDVQFPEWKGGFWSKRAEDEEPGHQVGAQPQSLFILLAQIWTGWCFLSSEELLGGFLPPDLVAIGKVFLTVWVGDLVSLILY